MANLDAGFGAASRERPRAIVEAFRPLRDDQPTPPARPAPSPKFCRINPGQLIRALILVVLCLGVVQLSHAEKSADDQNGFALASARRI